MIDRLAASSVRRPSALRSLPVLASETGLAVPTLTQLVSFLRLAGIVKQRSRGGGLALTRPASEISLLDVIHAIDGHTLWRRCLLGLPECTDAAPCPVHSTWKAARTALEKHLEGQSIADLTRALKKRRRLGRGRRRSRRRGLRPGPK